MIDRILAVLFDPARLRRIGLIWLVLAAVAYGLDLWMQTRVGLTNGAGRPFGDDFIDFWGAARLALSGQVGLPYDWMAFHRFHEALVGAPLEFYHYSYPPSGTLMWLPFGLVPYPWALAPWLVIGVLLVWLVVRAELPGWDGLLLTLAAPAVLVNAMGGQNGPYSAALLCGGLMLLPRRPVLAGVVIGLLAYKPHLGLLVPFALAAAGQGRAFVSAAVTVAAVIGISLLAFGPEPWLQYRENADILRVVILENGAHVWHRMVSVFVTGRTWGASEAIAYGAQAVFAGVALVTVVVGWRRLRDWRARAVVLVIGTLFAVPYLNDYDLVIAVPVAAWMTTLAGQYDGLDRRWLRLGGIGLICAPLVAAPIGKITGVQVATLVMVPAAVAAWRLVWGAQASSSASRESNESRPAGVAAKR